MRTTLLLFLLTAVAPLGQAQAPLTEADALMAQFATVWSADDIEALEALFIDDVVLHGLEETRGQDAVLAWARGQMAATPALALDPLHSAVQGRRAYQVGRWLLGTERGTHTFVWEQGDDGRWRIVSMLILNDAAL